MSIEKRTIIWCDHSVCGQGHQKLISRHRGTTAAEVREDGAKRGWKHIPGSFPNDIYSPPQDLCPRHNPTPSTGLRSPISYE